MKPRVVIIPVLSIFVVLANVLINAFQLGGVSTADISDKYFTSVTPYGLTFIIWGVIFLGLIIFSFYQALPAQRDKKYLDGLLLWYVIASVANVMWLVSWHFDLIVVTPVIMLVLLAALTAVWISLRSASLSPKKQDSVEQPIYSWADKIIVLGTFGAYLGWISVATIANIASFLISFGLKDILLPDEFWAAILVLIAGGLAAFFLWLGQDFAYAATVLWGLFGIANNNVQSNPIQMAFMASTVIILAMGVYALFVWYKSTQKYRTDYF